MTYFTKVKFDLKTITSTFGGSLAPSSETVGSLLTSPWPAKPAGKEVFYDRNLRLFVRSWTVCSCQFVGKDRSLP